MKYECYTQSRKECKLNMIDTIKKMEENQYQIRQVHKSEVYEL